MIPLSSLKGLWDRRHEVVLGLLIISWMLLYCAVVKIQALKGARSEVDIQTASHTVKAPTLTKEKERRFSRPSPPATPGADAEVVCPPIEMVEIEREILDGGEETNSSTSLHEKPVFEPEPWRALVLEYAPRSKRTAARLDLDLGKSFRASARHELPFAGRLAFEPWVGVGVRF